MMVSSRLVLGIETSGVRCSVALVRGGEVLGARSYPEPGKHAERVLGLLEALLESCRVRRSELAVVAAGIGPGSFVGLRVGLAFASGLGLGLGVPGVGVCSLRAMARSYALSPETLGEESQRVSDRRTRVTVVDARRGEFFVAAFSAEGASVIEPVTVAQPLLGEFLRDRVTLADCVMLGHRLDGVAFDDGEISSSPHAVGTALLGAEYDADSHPLSPNYLREADAIRPNLPNSPLLGPRL